ncbi:MAG: GTPase HflX [Flavobacteriales bacterium]|nr:GTPase HflX [Flavobacteriales bacterium]
MKGKLIDTTPVKETAVLVGVDLYSYPKGKSREYLEELSFLAETAGAHTVRIFSQKLDKPNSKTYLGPGKLEEIAAYVKENKIAMAIFDDELTPSQTRNLEEFLKCSIIDRSMLILDIFALNARTATAKAQVELARNEYLLPRLTRMWLHLDRQKGGIGQRGAGEKEIETDRRAIRHSISLLKEKLKHIDKQNITRRKNRDGLRKVALVGYTNVGKSTLMNLLAKTDVLAENKLFATLESTSRKVVIPDPDPIRPPLTFILSDTVGFIRKLPHQLVESFKSTLDEVAEADLLLHVVDVSHPGFEEQMEVVKKTLFEIGAAEKPVIIVFNKIDNYNPLPTAEDIFEDTAIYDINLLKQSWMAKENAPVVFISAANRQNIDEVREKILFCFNNIKFY